MAYNKKTWKARQGSGLNKFSIDGATPVPVINQPDSVTQQGDALSAGNLNDLEQRIADAFDDVEESKDALQSQINQHESRLENLEQKAGDYTTVQYRGTNAVPTGKAKNGLVEKIVGKTRAWNQLCPNNITTGVGYTRTSTTITITNPEYTNFNNVYANLGVTTITGHKYLIWTISNTSYLRVYNYYLGNTMDCTNGYVRNETYGYALRLGFAQGITAGTYNLQTIVSDLTLIFGAGNEPSTVADALTQLPALGQYNPYDAGSLVSTEVSGVKSVGVNIWDEEWESGGYTSQGQEQPDASHFRTKDYIAVLPSTDYYSTNITDRICYYDIGKNFISRTSGGAGNNRSWTTPADCFYIRFEVASPTYSNNIIVALGSTAVTYHPYKTDTLSLSETVTLRSAGNVVEVLDVRTGKKTRPLGTLDLGSLDYTSQSTGTQKSYYSPVIDDLKNPSSDSIKANIICQFYVISDTRSFVSRGDYILGVSASGRININDNRYSDAIALKSALNGVYLYYELATPLSDEQVCDPITDNTIYTEGGGTINTIQEQSPVIDNCLDVGYLTV